MPRLSATERAPAAVHTSPAESSASHPWAASATVSNWSSIKPRRRRFVSSSDHFVTAEFIARTDSPNGTSGTPKSAARCANSSSGGTHSTASAPRACSCTASPSRGSTPPRESYVDNNTRIPLLLYPQSCPKRLRNRQIHQFGQPGAMTVSGAKRQLIALGALEIQVRRILPRHSDAAVQLHALLGGVHGDATAVGLCDGRGDTRVFVATGAAVGGVAGGRRRGPDLEPQIRQPVLDRLVGADRATELLTLLGI